VAAAVVVLGGRVLRKAWLSWSSMTDLRMDLLIQELGGAPSPHGSALSLTLKLNSVNLGNVQELRTAFDSSPGVVGVRGTVEVDGFPGVVV
jgi:hypothetical protein